MFIMAMVLFIYVFCSLALPLKISWKYKVLAGLGIFVIAQKNGILRRLGGGMFFSPEMPRWLLLFVAFLYGVLFFTAAFMLLKDIFILPLWYILKYKNIIKKLWTNYGLNFKMQFLCLKIFYLFHLQR